MQALIARSPKAKTPLFLFAACMLLVSSSSRHLGAAELEQASLDRLELVDYRGRNWTLDDFKDDSILVVAFLGTECPLAKLYANELQEIADNYQDRSVQVVAVMSNRQDSLREIEAFARRQKLSFPVMKDAGNQFADQVGAERTPELFVYDAKRRLRYRGRVDDRYGIGYVRDEPRRRDLTIALQELLSGRQVSLPRTSAVGCIIGRSKVVDGKSDVTFTTHVAEILRKNCVGCHREGEIAPFSLIDYDEVAGWADMISEVVHDRRMPPWHATKEHQVFANDRTMSQEEIDTLIAWAEAGAPRGPEMEVAKLPKKVDGWQLPREPDVAFTITEGVLMNRRDGSSVTDGQFNVPENGKVRYQYFLVDPKFNEDVWLEAAELVPGNRRVVHHILCAVIPPGQRPTGAERSYLDVYVPGMRLVLPPKGHAKRIRAGSKLMFQLHYTPIGTPQKDDSRLGLLLADPDEITHEVRTMSAVETDFRIPAGDPAHAVPAIAPAFPKNAILWSLFPHMHLRGSAFRYTLVTQDGEEKTLMDVPQYDFNWQTSYVLAKPIAIPEGSRIKCVGTFDNSEENLANPDPTQNVFWGDQTDEEMMIGYYNYSVPRENETTSRERMQATLQAAGQLAVFDKLDSDKDGKLKREDTPRKYLDAFQRLDRNADGLLTREEASIAQ
jgi:peroxiredoxin